MGGLITSISIFWVIFHISNSQNPACVISTESGFPFNKQPLYILNGELAKPIMINGISSLAVNLAQPLTLGCPGTGNYVVGGNTKIQNATCSGGVMFVYNTVTMDVMYFNCSSNAQPSLVQTNRTCGATNTFTYLYEVGYQLDKWYKIFEACHDKNSTLSWFAQHRLNYMVEAGSQKNPDRPAFKKGLDSLYQGLNVDSLYTKVSQEAMFNATFPGKQYFSSTKYFFTKGHLTPDADFIFTTGQWSTYFYVDTAPQWFSLNSGNWLAVEKAVRKRANATGTDLDVATGTFEILKLPDINNNLVPVYLDPSVKGIPAPRIFWKSVFEPVSKAGIVFLMSNNPFANETFICPNICAQNGWTFTNSLDRGTVYCCTQNSLLTIIPYIPHNQVTTVLKGL